MRVLVTGGAGYVGSVLIRKLLNKKHDVIVFDTLDFGNESIISLKDIELYIGDFVGVGRKTLQRTDAVIHLAGVSTEPTSQYNPRQTDLVNHINSVELAKKAKEAGVGRFIYASSCSIYFTFDTPLNPPLSKEMDAVNPISAYSLSKRAAEVGIMELADNHFQPTILRKGTVYGVSPRMRYDLILNSFVKDLVTKGKIKVHCNGEIYRPILDIDEAADAYISSIELPIADVGGKIFNVVSRNIDAKSLARTAMGAVEGDYGITGQIDIEPVGIARNYMADFTEYKKVFKPTKRSLEEAIQDLEENVLINRMNVDKTIYYNDRHYAETRKR